MPTEANYTAASLLIVAVAIVARLILGGCTKKKEQQTNSDALIASGADAPFDAVVSLRTLLGAGATLLWNANPDGWMGAAIAVVILRACLGMLRNTLGDILGKRLNAQTAAAIRAEIGGFKGALGAYGLFLDSYGPRKQAGSVHIEVHDTMSAVEIDTLTRSISNHIFRKFGIVLTCGIYAVDTQSESLIALFFVRQTRRPADELDSSAGLLCFLMD